MLDGSSWLVIQNIPTHVQDMIIRFTRWRLESIDFLALSRENPKPGAMLVIHKMIPSVTPEF